MYSRQTAIPLRGVLIILVGLVVLPGCSNTPNPVASNISYGPDDQFANRTLDAAERRQVIRIMQDAVVGPTNDPARPAPYGARWTDVTHAATQACATLDMAILSVTEEQDGMLKRVEIISVGDVPYELLVHRLPAPEIFKATATGGLFDDQTETAEKLVRAFNKSMLAFGAKPGWPELTND